MNAKRLAAFSIGLLLLPLACGCVESTNTAAEPAAGQFSISARFSPQGGCTEAVVDEIARARGSIEVQAYSFTSTPIAKALVDAHNRGVKIVAILDKSQRTEQYSEADFLLHAGIPTYIDAKHAIAHNKIMLIDGATIITGSFNFTNQAEKANAENLLLIKNDPPLYAEYEANFQNHLQHSEPYQGRAEGGVAQDDQPKQRQASRKKSRR